MASRNGSSLLISCLLLLVAAVDFAASQVQNCQGENYSPCSCDLDSTGTGFQVTCNRINMTEVRRVFASTSTAKLARLSLTPSPSDQEIPADLLRGKQVTNLVLLCPDRPNSPLVVNAAAFISTQTATTSLTIGNCRLSELDWSFLTGFSALTSLEVDNCNNFHGTFYTLPPLDRLSRLILHYVAGQNQWTLFPQLARGLSRFELYYSLDVNDTTIGRVLDWLAVSSSSSLTFVSIAGNKLTGVPRQIASFPNLRTINIYNNLIPMTISTGSYPFAAPNVYLDSSRISVIQPGAFQGDYSNSFVELYSNQLTRFESGVFRSMLQQMSQASGQLELYDNPFDCTTDPCHLAWLIRDSPELLSPIWSAQCSNGTYFHQLNSSGFNSCP